MTVVLIIGILLAIAIPSFSGYRKRTQANACRVNMRMVAAAVEEARLETDSALSDETGGWKDDAEFEVTQDSFLARYFSAPTVPTCPVDGSNYKVIMTKEGKVYKVSVLCTAANVSGHDISDGKL